MQQLGHCNSCSYSAWKHRVASSLPFALGSYLYFPCIFGSLQANDKFALFFVVWQTALSSPGAVHGLTGVWPGRGAWHMQRTTTHQSKILFSQLTSQGGKGKFRSQFIIYGHLNWGLREQPSAAQWSDTRHKTKEKEEAEHKQKICPEMLQGFQCFNVAKCWVSRRAPAQVN